MSRALLFTLVSLIVLAACGDDHNMHTSGLCAQDSRAETYVAGMEKTGTGGLVKAKLMENKRETAAGSGVFEAHAPDMGNNKWTLHLSDAAGAPIESATVNVKTWMPDHGHGGRPVNNAGRSLGSGDYDVGPFDLFMGGLWELTVEVTAPMTDSAVFSFCFDE